MALSGRPSVTCATGTESDVYENLYNNELYRHSVKLRETKKVFTFTAILMNLTFCNENDYKL